MNIMIQAAQKAARSLVRDFGEVENLQVSRKGPGDFVSAADKRAEEILYTELSKARPGFGFLMEEGGAIEGTDGRSRFIIDPLDGTTNFLHGQPHFAISLALMTDEVLVAGLIYNPVTDEMFTAERGQGAQCNGRRLRVAQRGNLADCVVATGIPHLGRRNPERFIREMAAMMPATAGTRSTGSAALNLAYVAAGRLDAYWEYGLNEWDVAAGIILVREAGGFVSAPVGKDSVFDSGDILAANEKVHDALRALFAGTRVKSTQAAP